MAVSNGLPLIISLVPYNKRNLTSFTLVSLTAL